MGRAGKSGAGRLHLAVLFALTATAAPCAAASIVQDISGTSSSRFQFYWGQSFTTPAGSGWRDISFNFYDQSQLPYAAGTGYLFDRAYTGTPAGLATAAALAVSMPANGSRYDFAPGFKLRAGKAYFLYADAPMRIRGGGSANVGGTAVFTQFGSHAYAAAGGGNADFQVSGTSLAVPEPASWAMLTIGFACIGFVRRRAAPTSFNRETEV
ncbi:MAG: hypothetical protein RL490_882 [Pseudomonadota bacterium]|jgi:hypothetical protein